MTYPENYNCLSQQVFQNNEYKLIPIRYEDRLDIMKWRNEQIYHLRQDKPLTNEDQDNYYQNVVSQLFEEEKPDQILFSFLKDDELIGYGGLVHINWIDRNAEISFIMATHLEEDYFEEYWIEYLKLIERVAFKELQLGKIFTYAFNLRPRLYVALESVSFVEEARLKNHCLFDGVYRDVLIHSKFNTIYNVTYRLAKDDDITTLYNWANDPVSRANSFNSNEIMLENHKKWFKNKMNDQNTLIFIAEDDINEGKIGVSRYEINENHSVVGIHIDKNYRGKGLSSIILKNTAELYFKETSKPIWAYIKKDNIPSQKAFEKAGYTFLKNDIVNEYECFVYKLEYDKK